MKKRLTILFALALCALSALVGCSSGSGGASMVGYWELTGGESGGEKLTENMVKAMADEDLHCILHLSDDGKAVLDLFGDVEDGTWNADKSTAKFGDDKMTLKLDGEKLTVAGEDDDKLVFKKGDDSLAKKVKKDRKAKKEGESGTEVETQRVAIDPPVTIVDDEVANITAVARVVDENGMGGVELAITNKSGERFASHTLDDASVNGGTYEIYYYADVNAGETVNEVVAFDGVTTIDELKDINFTLTIYDTMTFNDLGVYDVNVP